MRSRTLPRAVVATLATVLTGAVALGTQVPTSDAAAPATAAPTAAADRHAPEGRAAHGAGRDRAVAAASAFVRSHSPSRSAGGAPSTRTGTVAGTKGTFYVTYGRSYRGLPVYGGDFVVAVDAAGRAIGASGAPPARSRWARPGPPSARRRPRRRHAARSTSCAASPSPG